MNQLVDLPANAVKSLIGIISYNVHPLLMLIIVVVGPDLGIFSLHDGVFYLLVVSQSEGRTEKEGIQLLLWNLRCFHLERQ